jgi:hypothetical protein
MVDSESINLTNQDEISSDSTKDPSHTTTKPSRLEDLKYSFCPDDEPDELASEMLMRATNPKKIGLFSTGGLSNRIIDQIQKDYQDMFKDQPFETYFETLQRSIIPIRTDSGLPPAHKMEDTEEMVDTLTEETIEDEHFEPDLPETDLTTPLEIEDDEYIFEPDPESEIDEIINNSPKDPVKPLTFRQRAQHIFHELKRRLGLIHEPEQDVPVTDRQPVSEPEITTGPEPETETTSSEESLVEPHEPASDDHLESQTTSESREEIPPTASSVKPLDSPEKELEYELASAKPEQMLSPAQEVQTEVQTEKPNVARILEDKDVIFLFTCLDDEFDIENSLILSELAKKNNILTVVIASLPRYFGKVENVYATNRILQRLRLMAEFVILIPYFETIKFKLIPMIIKELLEVIMNSGLINVDVADLKIVVKGGNVGVITFGNGRHAKRHKDALFSAIDSILLNVELAGVKKALLNVYGSKDITLEEVEGLANQIKNRIAPGARFILGTSIVPTMTDEIKIFLLLGVTPMQVMVNMYANE